MSNTEKKDKSKLTSIGRVFYEPWYSYSSIEYEPTKVTLVVALVVLLWTNIGNAYCLMMWLDTSNTMNIDCSSIQWAQSILGNLWVNITLTLAAGFVFCNKISIRTGQSGRASIIEKIKWKSDVEIKAAASRKMYDQYKSIYSEIDKFIVLRQDKMEPDAWDKMNNQLMSIYDLLSMHKGSKTLPIKMEIDSFAKDDEMFAGLIKQAKSFKAELEDLISIWKSPYGFNNVNVGFTSEKDEENLEQVARSLGLDSIIDSYYSGVPIEDLLT